MAIEVKGNVGDRIAGDDWKPTEESEMAIGIGGLEIFEGEVAEARGFEARFKVFEAFGRSHFADAQNIGLNFFDDGDNGDDGSLGFWFGVDFFAFGKRDDTQIIFEVIGGNDDRLGGGDGGGNGEKESEEAEGDWNWGEHMSQSKKTDNEKARGFLGAWDEWLGEV